MAESGVTTEKPTVALSLHDQGDAVTPDNASPVKQEHERPPTLSAGQFSIIALGVCLGLFLSFIDTSIVATSLYTIGVEFDSIKSVNWVALAYTLAYLGCAVPFARIADIVGRRDAFVAAYVIFLAFSIGCGFAQTLHQLIAFRVMQGIGGSGLYSLTMIMLPEVCPPHMNAILGAIIGLVVAGAGVLGPLLGGILTDYASWRWVFWINGPVGAVSVVIFFLSWPKADRLPPVERRKWKEFDFLGTILVIAAAVLTVFSFQNAGEAETQVWDQVIFIVPLTLGVACWLGLFAWEEFVSLKLGNRLAPAFPLELFRNRVYTSGALCTLLIGFPYLLLIFSLPIRLQIVSGKSPLVAGLMLLPMLGSVAVATVVAGKLNSIKNTIFETILTGTCFMLLGCGLLTTIGGSEDDGKALGYIVFCGVGFGLVTPAVTILTTLESPAREHAPAQGIVAQVRILGGSLGIAMSTALVSDESRKYLTGVLSPEQQATLGQGGQPMSPEAEAAVDKAYEDAFHYGMIAATAVCGVAVLVALGTYRKGPRKLMMEQREAMRMPQGDDLQQQSPESPVQDRQAEQLA